MQGGTHALAGNCPLKKRPLTLQISGPLIPGEIPLTPEIFSIAAAAQEGEDAHATDEGGDVWLGDGGHGDEAGAS